MKYEYNTNVFLDKSEYCYYFLGFIYADGCLTNGYLSININNKDIEILERFKTYLNTKKPIYHIEKTNSILFSFKNKKIYETLINYGLTPRKSLITTFPDNIPDDMVHHFIRGYFDGDGCISIINRKTIKGLKINIVGTYEFLNSLQKILITKIGITPKKISQITSNKNTYQLNFKSKSDVLKFKEFIYNGSTIFLNRKKEVFNTNVTIKIKDTTSSIYKNVCLRKKTKKWSALYYLNKIRKEKSGFLNEYDAYEFLKNNGYVE